MNPFEYLNSINYTKEHLLVDFETEKSYPAYMVNRGLSYFPDTILFANQMNGFSHIDNKLQYDFYFYGVNKRKRFSKWAKKEPESNTLRSVMDYYKYSEEKALEVINILTNDQITTIEERMYKGGRT
jgi:hypothetical protein